MLRLLLLLLSRVEVRGCAPDEWRGETPCYADEEEGEDVVEDRGLVGRRDVGIWVHCGLVLKLLFWGDRRCSSCCQQLYGECTFT